MPRIPRRSKITRKAPSHPRAAATSLTARLKQIPFFESFSSQDFFRLAAVVEEKKVKAGSVIFEEGDSADALFLIEKGRVSIYKKFKKDVPHEIAVLSDGDFFGEMGLTERLPRSASAQALEDSLLVVLNAKDLLHWFHADTRLALQVGAKLVRGLSERLRQATEERNSLISLGTSLLETVEEADLWRIAAAEFSRAVAPDAAAGGVIFTFNPYLEEFVPCGHWGAAPSAYLAARKELEESSGMQSVPLQEGPLGACVIFFGIQERVFSKKMPMIRTFSALIRQALVRVMALREQELKERLKNPPVST